MSKRQDKSVATRVMKIFLFVVLLVYSISMVSMLLWGVMTSFKSGLDFDYFSRAIGLPQIEYSKEEMFQFKNYVEVFKHFAFDSEISFYSGGKEVIHSSENNIWTMTFNSLFITFSATLLQTLLPCIMAYVCARFPYKLSEIIYITVVLVMTIPIQGTTVPMIELMRGLNLFDTYIGYIIQNFTFSGMYFLVFYGSFKSFANTYAEAAEIDGANQYQILFLIVLPLSIMMIGTVFLIKFIQIWDNYQSPMVWMPTHPTLAYGVYRLIHEEGSLADLRSVPRQVAACMILAIPVFILFIICKDKIMGNVTVGGLKG